MFRMLTGTKPATVKFAGLWPRKTSQQLCGPFSHTPEPSTTKDKLLETGWSTRQSFCPASRQSLSTSKACLPIETGHPNRCPVIYFHNTLQLQSEAPNHAELSGRQLSQSSEFQPVTPTLPSNAGITFEDSRDHNYRTAPAILAFLPPSASSVRVTKTEVVNMRPAIEAA